MATHASAEKRARQAEKARLRNRSNMATMRTIIRKVEEAMTAKNFDGVDALFRDAQATIARTRRKGCIHVNNMARRISRLAARVNKFKATKTV